MRTITVIIHNDKDAEDAFSIIDQSLSDAKIGANITLSYEDPDADRGTSRVPPETQRVPRSS
jgi:predicted glycoside hydrolase/deacetylase ChbG (UPF0249 family)